MPNVTTPSHHSLHSGGRRVDGRSDVQIEDGFARRLWISGVIVDYVANLLSCAAWCPAYDIPIVAVEGWLGAGKRVTLVEYFLYVELGRMNVPKFRRPDITQRL